MIFNTNTFSHVEKSAIDITQRKIIRFLAPKSQKSEIDSTHVSEIVGLAPKSQKSTGAIAPKHPA